MFLKLWRERLPCSLQGGPPIHWGVPERLLEEWREKEPLIDWALVKTAAAPASPGLVFFVPGGAEIAWVFIGRGAGGEGVAVQPAPRCVGEAPRRPDRNKLPDDPGRAPRH